MSLARSRPISFDEQITGTTPSWLHISWAYAILFLNKDFIRNQQKLHNVPKKHEYEYGRNRMFSVIINGTEMA